MPVLPIEIGDFGGLNLTTDPQEVQHTGAIDALNVLLDYDGRLRARDGFASFASSLSPMIIPLGAAYTGGKLYVLGKDNANKLTYSTVTGAGVVTTGTMAAVTAGGYAWATTAGDATNLRAFFTTESTNDLYYDAGLTLAGVGGGPLGVTPWDFRLVTAKGSRLRFSDPGAALTFGANNYIDLHPNDGDTINEIVAWRDLLFVFKSTKFYVFYGTSADGAGNPIFNYRTVNTGHGCLAAGAAAATEGVYFVDTGGMWLTTGGPPKEMSAAISPLFTRDRSLPYTSSTVTDTVLNSQRLSVAVTRHQVWVWMGTVWALAMDRRTQAWTAHMFQAGLKWAVGFTASASGTVNFPDTGLDLFFGIGSTVYRMVQGLTTDVSSVINSNYRTGFVTPAVFSSARTRRGYPWPGAEGVVREWLIDGSGTVTVKTAVNDGVTLGAGASVTLGAAPVIAQGRDRRAVRGRNVSLDLSGTGAWSVSRAIANVMDSRGPGTESA